MDEHMREKEMARMQADEDAKRQEEARMMAKLNGTSQPINLNHQTMIEFDEHMREKEMARIQADEDARRQEEARMMAELNGNFDYADDISEEVVHKRR